MHAKQFVISTCLGVSIATSACSSNKAPVVYYSEGNLMEVLAIKIEPSDARGSLEISYANFGSAAVHKLVYDLRGLPTDPGGVDIVHNGISCGRLVFRQTHNQNVFMVALPSGDQRPFKVVSKADIDSSLEILQKVAAQSQVPNAKTVSSDPIFVPHC
jgi:hypothetical protein